MNLVKTGSSVNRTFKIEGETQMPKLIGTTTEPDNAGVTGDSSQWNGVIGVTHATNFAHAGVAGVADDGIGNGVYGRSAMGTGVLGESNNIGIIGKGGQLAGQFLGNVQITGSLDVQGTVLYHDGVRRVLHDVINSIQDQLADIRRRLDNAGIPR
jgi:hypothetical protein